MEFVLSTCSHKGEVQLSTFVVLHLVTLTMVHLLGRGIPDVHVVVAALLAITPTKLHLNPFVVRLSS